MPLIRYGIFNKSTTNLAGSLRETRLLCHVPPTFPYLLFYHTTHILFVILLPTASAYKYTFIIYRQGIRNYIVRYSCIIIWNIYTFSYIEMYGFVC